MYLKYLQAKKGFDEGNYNTGGYGFDCCFQLWFIYQFLRPKVFSLDISADPIILDECIAIFVSGNTPTPIAPMPARSKTIGKIAN